MNFNVERNDFEITLSRCKVWLNVLSTNSMLAKEKPRRMESKKDLKFKI